MKRLKIFRDHLARARNYIDLALAEPYGKAVDEKMKGMLTEITEVLNDLVKVADEIKSDGKKK